MFRRSLLPALAAISLIPAPSLAQASTPSLKPSAIPVTVPAVAPATQTTIATLLPKDTAGVFLINTDDTRWKALQQFGLFPKDFAFPGFLYPLEKGVNFATDVQPWLGDQVGFALLSSNSYVTIAAVKDPAPVAKFIEKMKRSRKQPAKEIQSKGVTILEWEPEPIKPISGEPEATIKSQELKDSTQQPKAKPRVAPIKRPPVRQPIPETPENQEPGMVSPFKPQPLVIAVVPGHVITSTSVQTVQKLIDIPTGERLLDHPQFQRTVQDSRYAKSLFAGYGKYTALLKATNELNQQQRERLGNQFPEPPKLNDKLLNDLERFYDTMNGFVWVETNGIHSEFALNFKEAIPETLITPFTTKNEILQRLPELNYAVSNSQNLSLIWRIFILGFEAQPTFQKPLAQFRDNLRKTIGVDDRDIFPWMTGEYAVFMYPTRKGFMPQMGFDMGMGLMVETNDRKTADAAIDKVNQFLKRQFSATSNKKQSFGSLFQQRTILGESATELGMFNRGKPSNYLSYSWVNPNTFLVLAGGGALDDFSPKPNRTLPQSVNFQAAIAPFQDANMGYFYVNGGAMTAFVNTSLLPTFVGVQAANSPFLDEYKAMVGSIRSLSGASSITPTQLKTQGFLSLTARRSTPKK
jgi:hypothetical protein